MVWVLTHVPVWWLLGFDSGLIDMHVWEWDGFFFPAG